MNRLYYYLAGLAVFTLIPNASAEPYQVIGWLEYVRIQPQNIQFKAKIDTGADNSSIHADNIVVYEENGRQRVKFTVSNADGESANLDLPLLRFAKIKRKKADPIRRPVVTLELCIGNTLKRAPVNLASRGNFKYRMLIGRSFLKGGYLVNASEQYTIEPACQNDTQVQHAKP